MLLSYEKMTDDFKSILCKTYANSSNHTYAAVTLVSKTFRQIINRMGRDRGPGVLHKLPFLPITFVLTLSSAVSPLGMFLVMV